MKKALWTFLVLGVSSVMKRLQAHQGGHMELTRLKMSLAYIQSIKTFRLLFMSLLSMGACLIFLFVGLILFHATLFLYAPWGMATKMCVGLFCSAGYLLLTYILFTRTFDSDKWLKIFHADAIINLLQKEDPKG
jgi:hypothetical protein